MNQAQVVEFRKDDQFSGDLMIMSATDAVSSNGSKYLTLMLGDKTGEIETKVWSVTQEQIDSLKAGIVLSVTGVVTEFRGALQMKLQSYEIQTDQYDMADFIKTAPVGKQEMYDEIVETIKSMDNTNIRSVTSRLFKDYMKEFIEHPAARKMHHNYNGGLAFHTVSMLRSAKALAECYKPLLNEDLLYAGVILHDIGKIREMTSGIETEYTLEGSMLGHIHMMIEEIAMKAREIGCEQTEEIILLKHLIASHHGKPEWGSAITPQIPEAIVLHTVDKLDADMEMIRTEFEKTETGTTTGRIFGLDGRKIYKHGVL